MKACPAPSQPRVTQHMHAGSIFPLATKGQSLHSMDSRITRHQRQCHHKDPGRRLLPARRHRGHADAGRAPVALSAKAWPSRREAALRTHTCPALSSPGSALHTSCTSAAAPGVHLTCGRPPGHAQTPSQSGAARVPAHRLLRNPMVSAAADTEGSAESRWCASGVPP